MESQFFDTISRAERRGFNPSLTETLQLCAARTGLSDLHTEWRISTGTVAYPDAVACMEHRVAAIHAGTAPEMIWLLEHPALYTAGTSAKPAGLLRNDHLPVFASGRGGEYTYHGPGQVVAYVMLDLNRRGRDLRGHVSRLEQWMIAVLADFGVTGETRADRPGVWVRRPNKGGGAEDKIAAVGVRVRRWVTYHGVSLNVSPDLSHYDGIVPCGLRGYGVTSLAELGVLTNDSIGASLMDLSP